MGCDETRGTDGDDVSGKARPVDQRRVHEWAAAAASGFVNRYGDAASSTIAQTQLCGPMMSAVWASEGDYSGCWAGEDQAYGLPKGVCFVDVTEHPSPSMI